MNFFSERPVFFMIGLFNLAALVFAFLLKEILGIHYLISILAGYGIAATFAALQMASDIDLKNAQQKAIEKLADKAVILMPPASPSYWKMGFAGVIIPAVITAVALSVAHRDDANRAHAINSMMERTVSNFRLLQMNSHDLAEMHRLFEKNPQDFSHDRFQNFILMKQYDVLAQIARAQVDQSALLLTAQGVYSSEPLQPIFDELAFTKFGAGLQASGEPSGQ